MMPPYRLAHLTPDQMMSIESLENEMGVTLVAYEPMCDAVRDSATNNLTADYSDDLVLDALNDTYRTYDPHI
ncbi:MAG TPA: hypothetical protein VD973_07245 [Symbiobacteriaceae bacterium]|jgi:hypothetical protein|nr:hypothetical protein [Symbiobacteriaceae bacterium]